MDTSDITRLLTVTAITLESGVLALILFLCRKADKHLPRLSDFKADLQACLQGHQNLPAAREWVYQLFEVAGSENRSVATRNILAENLYPYNNSIRSLTSLGPVIGLFFTFMGMLVSVEDLAKVDLVADHAQVRGVFQGLIPIFLGGAGGIAVFGFGTWLLDRLEKAQRTCEDKIVRSYFEFVRSQEGLNLGTPDEMLSKLLRKVATLASRFDAINESYEALCGRTNDLVANISRSADALIQSVGDSSRSMSGIMSANADHFATLAGTVNTYTGEFRNAASTWAGSVATIRSLSDAVSSLQTDLRTLTSLTTAFVELKGGLETSSSASRALVSAMQGSQLEYDTLVRKLTTTSDSISDYVGRLHAGTLDLQLIESRINAQLEAVSSQMEKMAEHIPTSVLKSKEELLQHIGRNGRESLTTAVPIQQVHSEAHQGDGLLPGTIDLNTSHLETKLDEYIGQLRHLHQSIAGFVSELRSVAASNAKKRNTGFFGLFSRKSR